MLSTQRDGTVSTNNVKHRERDATVAINNVKHRERDGIVATNNVKHRDRWYCSYGQCLTQSQMVL